MNCSQCGAVVEEGLKFCRKCGARIEIADFNNSEKQGQLGKQGGLEAQEEVESQGGLKKKSSLGRQEAIETQEEQQGIQLLARPTRIQHPAQGEANAQELQGLNKSIAMAKGIKDKNAEAAAQAEIAATIDLKNSQAQALLSEIQNKNIAQDKTQKNNQAAVNGQTLSRTQLHKKDAVIKRQNINKAKSFMARNKIKSEDGKLPKAMRNQEVGTNELKLFFNFMKDFIKHPLMDKEALDERMEDKNTFIYMGVLVALNTLMSVILMEFILRGLKDLIDIVAYLMSNLNADIHYLTGKIGLSFIMGSLVMNIGHIVIFALLMSVIGSRIMKQDIKGQEVCKYMLAPLGVLVVGKLPVVFITILSVKLGLVLYVLLVGMMMIVGMAALEKRYGRNEAGIYSISGLYLLSMSISTLAGIKIMMMF